MDEGSVSPNADMGAQTKFHQDADFANPAKKGVTLGPEAPSSPLQPDLNVKIISSSLSSKQEPSPSCSSAHSFPPCGPHQNSYSAQYFGILDAACHSSPQEENKVNSHIRYNPNILPKHNQATLPHTDKHDSSLTKYDYSSLAQYANIYASAGAGPFPMENVHPAFLDQLFKVYPHILAYANPSSIIQLAKLDPVVLANLDQNTIYQLAQLDPHTLSKLDHTMLAPFAHHSYPVQAQRMEALSKMDPATLPDCSGMDPLLLSKLQQSTLVKLDPHNLSTGNLATPAQQTPTDAVTYTSEKDSNAYSKIDQATQRKALEINFHAPTKKNEAMHNLPKLNRQTMKNISIAEAPQFAHHSSPVQAQRTAVLSTTDSATLPDCSRMDPFVLSKLHQSTLVQLDTHTWSPGNLATLAQQAPADAFAHLSEKDSNVPSKIDKSTQAQPTIIHPHALTMKNVPVHNLFNLNWQTMKKISSAEPPQIAHCGSPVQTQKRADISTMDSATIPDCSRMDPLLLPGLEQNTIAQLDPHPLSTGSLANSAQQAPTDGVDHVLEKDSDAHFKIDHATPGQDTAIHSHALTKKKAAKQNLSNLNRQTMKKISSAKPPQFAHHISPALAQRMSESSAMGFANPPDCSRMDPLVLSMLQQNTLVQLDPHNLSTGNLASPSQQAPTYTVGHLSEKDSHGHSKIDQALPVQTTAIQSHALTLNNAPVHRLFNFNKQTISKINSTDPPQFVHCGFPIQAQKRDTMDSVNLPECSRMDPLMLSKLQQITQAQLDHHPLSTGNLATPARQAPTDAVSHISEDSYVHSKIDQATPGQATAIPSHALTKKNVAIHNLINLNWQTMKNKSIDESSQIAHRSSPEQAQRMVSFNTKDSPNRSDCSSMDPLKLSKLQQSSQVQLEPHTFSKRNLATQTRQTPTDVVTLISGKDSDAHSKIDQASRGQATAIHFHSPSKKNVAIQKLSNLNWQTMKDMSRAKSPQLAHHRSPVHAQRTAVLSTMDSTPLPDCSRMDALALSKLHQSTQVQLNPHTLSTGNLATPAQQAPTDAVAHLSEKDYDAPSKIEQATQAQPTIIHPHALTMKKVAIHNLLGFNQQTMKEMSSVKLPRLSMTDYNNLTKEELSYRSLSLKRDYDNMAKNTPSSVTQLSKHESHDKIKKQVPIPQISPKVKGDSKRKPLLKLGPANLSTLDLKNLSKLDSKHSNLAKEDSLTFSKLDLNALGQLVESTPHMLSILDSTALVQFTKFETQQLQAAAAAAGLSKADLAELCQVYDDAKAPDQHSDLAESIRSSAETELNTNTSSAHGMTKFQLLLAVIKEIKKDLYFTYAGSRSSAERLKYDITCAQTILRACLTDSECAAP